MVSVHVKADFEDVAENNSIQTFIIVIIIIIMIFYIPSSFSIIDRYR
jgi:hypothetical protein